MRMLPVDVDQLFAQFAQLPERDAAPVDERARTATGIDHPTQQAGATVRVGQFARLQPLRNTRFASDVELGRQFGPITPRAHHARVGPAAKQQPERIDQDRLAGAGLSGQRGEARLELEFEAVDDHEIADRQGSQRGDAAVVRRGRHRYRVSLHLSFSRSMWK